jgi:beta-N-acetylhexosaminidase
MPRGGIPLLALAGLAAALNPACGDDGDGPTDTRTAGSRPSARGEVDRLSLRQQVGQLVVLSFRGLTPPRYVHSIMRDRTAAGVVLFAHNVDSAGQLRALTRSLQASAGGGALVCTDQEGGPVRIVRFAASSAGQPEQDTSGRAADAARATARDLRGLGINVNLGPVADVAGEGSVMRGRAYPGGTDRVAALVGAAVGAYRSERLAAAPKHFPGFGAATSNTDDGPVTIPAAATELRARDLAPFRAAVRAGAPLIMASHALYPALDPSRIASQSPAILGGILRRELGYLGAVVTDSIEADAVLRRSPVEEGALQSVQGGSDLVLMTGPGSYPRVYRRLLAEAHRSPAFRARVREAAARVLELKRRLGLPRPV